MIDVTVLLITVLTFLSGSSVVIMMSVHYKLGKIETIIGLCPVCQHHTAPGGNKPHTDPMMMG